MKTAIIWAAILIVLVGGFLYYRHSGSPYPGQTGISTSQGNPAATGTVSGTTDTIAPSVPTNVTATAVSSSQINLSWGASTDNVGVTGYRVYRNGAPLTTTSAISYSSTGLSAGTTYTYTVVAYDAAHNISSQSNTASAKTLGTSVPAPSPSPTPAPTPSPSGTLSTHSVGYIGCSNSKGSVDGYHLVAGNKDLMWPGYQTGGGRIDLWADPNGTDPNTPGSRTYWSKFDAEVAMYGQPTAVWVQLCEQTKEAINTYAQVQAMFANLKKHAPSATYYVSAINIYSPYAGLCSFMGATGQGETDTVNWRDQAVAAGLAKRGPDMGPLTSADVNSDGCHPNAAGQNVLGENLTGFFDSM